MKTYIYDSTIEGFFTVLFQIFKVKDYDAIISHKKNSLFDKIMIETDYEKYERVLKSIKNKLSKLILDNILYTFLSDNENKEMYILRYLQFAFEKGKKVESYITDSRVKKIHDVVIKVSVEKHRLKGLLRFRELKDGAFYSMIEPDNDVLILLAKHFKNRFSNQNWIIHDLKRKKALVYMDKQIELLEIIENEELLDKKNMKFLSKSEKDYQEMWQEYFKSINIKERKNLKLQRSSMPKRYWKNLIEL